MQHNQIHQQRTAIYQWFSQLLFRELDEKQLASLESGDNRAWIASLAAIPGLSVEVKHFVRSLERVLRRDSRQLELAADFASLFMLSPPASVSPYAGHYPHTTAAAERRQMNVLLVEQGLAPHSQLKCNKVTHWSDPDRITVLALLEIPLHAGKTSDSERAVLH